MEVGREAEQGPLAGVWARLDELGQENAQLRGELAAIRKSVRSAGLTLTAAVAALPRRDRD